MKAEGLVVLERRLGGLRRHCSLPCETAERAWWASEGGSSAGKPPPRSWDLQGAWRPLALKVFDLERPDSLAEEALDPPDPSMIHPGKTSERCQA